MSTIPDILPDCRTVNPTGRKHDAELGVLIPIYCGNCGKSGGMVTEESVRHCFYLCDPCGEKWGPIAGTYVVPDAVFFAQARAEQMEKYGRLLTPSEMAVVVEEAQSPLALLARDLSRSPARRA